MNVLEEIKVLEHTDLLIAGKPRPTTDRMEDLDPATGEPMAAVARARPEDVQEAIDAARAVQRSWADRPPRERGQILFELARLIRQNADELSRLESLDTGKPLAQAKVDVEVAAQYYEFYAGFADKLYGHTIPMGGPSMAMTFREPKGVCAIIVPWNYPIQIGSRGVAPCLMAGNAVILKPASEAPLTGMALGTLALQAGLPPGVLNVVTGPGSVVGDYLAGSSEVNHIAFTGSVETGSSVMTRAAENVTPLTLELGGKCPSIVLPDADLDKAIPVLTKACIQNAGQTCSAGTRVVVHSSIHDEVVDRLGDTFSRVKLGHGVDDPDMGPLISNTQRKIVSEYVDIGKNEGGKLVTGGKQAEVSGLPGGFFYDPTLFAGIKPEMRIAQEEIFGPVLSVLSAKNEKEAIDIANGTEFGLVSSVWTRDLEHAIRVARSIDHGQVYINSYGAGGGVPLPFGGYKKSGFGREKGVEGVYEYTQIKTVILNIPAE